MRDNRTWWKIGAFVSLRLSAIFQRYQTRLHYECDERLHCHEIAEQLWAEGEGLA